MDFEQSLEAVQQAADTLTLGFGKRTALEALQLLDHPADEAVVDGHRPGRAADRPDHLLDRRIDGPLLLGGMRQQVVAEEAEDLLQPFAQLLLIEPVRIRRQAP